MSLPPPARRRAGWRWYSLAALACVLLGGCIGPPEVKLPSVTALPDGRSQILAMAHINNAAMSVPALALYLVDAAGGDVALWQLQGGRAVVEDGVSAGSLSHWVSWSLAQDGLIFDSPLGGEQGPFLIGRDGLVQKLRLPQPDISRRAWSPDGHRVSYIGSRLDGDDRHREDLFLLDLASGAARQLTELPPGYTYEPTWSPDGSRLAFVFWDAARSLKVVYSVGADGGGLTALLDPSAPQPFPMDWEFTSVLKWSPDGRSIAFLAPSSAGGLRTQDGGRPFNTVWLLDAVSGALSELKPSLPADPPTDIQLFDWSPDGQRLVLMAGYGGSCRTMDESGGPICTSLLYLMDADGGNLTRLSNVEMVNGAALVWIP